MLSFNHCENPLQMEGSFIVLAKILYMAVLTSPMNVKFVLYKWNHSKLTPELETLSKRSQWTLLGSWLSILGCNFILVAFHK